MLTMIYKIKLGSYLLGLLDEVEIHTSVELLADTATIKLPAARYNESLGIEQKIKRGDKVAISIGYKESGFTDNFNGYIQSISTDNGSITICCEDELYNLRKAVKNRNLVNVSLSSLLDTVLSDLGGGYTVDCSYSWTYKKFVIADATAYDVIKKVQDECGADIYLKGKVLHIHAPAEKVGENVKYDFSVNVEDCDLTYRSAEDKKYKIVIKSTAPDGTVKKVEIGSSYGDKKEIMCPTDDTESMKKRGETELKRLSFDGFEGSIHTWLLPYCEAGYSAEIKDKDYPEKDGKYFVQSVTTTFSESGGKRKIELGIRLS